MLSPGEQKRKNDSVGRDLRSFGVLLVLHVQGAAEKSGPLNFLAVFSATVWDFNTKFYSFIYRNLLHLTAK